MGVNRKTKTISNIKTNANAKSAETKDFWDFFSGKITKDEELKKDIAMLIENVNEKELQEALDNNLIKSPFDEALDELLFINEFMQKHPGMYTLNMVAGADDEKTFPLCAPESVISNEELTREEWEDLKINLFHKSQFGEEMIEITEDNNKAAVLFAPPESSFLGVDQELEILNAYGDLFKEILPVLEAVEKREGELKDDKEVVDGVTQATEKVAKKMIDVLENIGKKSEEKDKKEPEDFDEDELYNNMAAIQLSLLRNAVKNIPEKVEANDKKDDEYKDEKDIKNVNNIMMDRSKESLKKLKTIMKQKEIMDKDYKAGDFNKVLTDGQKILEDMMFEETKYYINKHRGKKYKETIYKQYTKHLGILSIADEMDIASRLGYTQKVKELSDYIRKVNKSKL